MVNWVEIRVRGIGILVKNVEKNKTVLHIFSPITPEKKNDQLESLVIDDSVRLVIRSEMSFLLQHSGSLVGKQHHTIRNDTLQICHKARINHISINHCQLILFKQKS